MIQWWETQKARGGYSDIAGKENTALPCNSAFPERPARRSMQRCKSSVRTSESRSSAKYSRQLLWTTDPEFADFAQTEQFGTKVYFAHPYTSWERAQNERQNGMLRRYVPKGVFLENFSDEEILWAADALNGLPRRNLGYYTARWRNCLRLSWIPFTQPERLRKPPIGLIIEPLST